MTKMSRRSTIPELTDPGAPPEEALDATLRALAQPVRREARVTAVTSGEDAALYHAGPRLPPKAHIEHGAADTLPDAAPPIAHEAEGTDGKTLLATTVARIRPAS